MRDFQLETTDSSRNFLFILSTTKFRMKPLKRKQKWQQRQVKDLNEDESGARPRRPQLGA